MLNKSFFEFQKADISHQTIESATEVDFMKTTVSASDTKGAASKKKVSQLPSYIITKNRIRASGKGTNSKNSRQSPPDIHKRKPHVAPLAHLGR